MKCLILTAVVAILALAAATPAHADDSARRARAALALSAGDGCGKCLGDIDECRAEATRQGKPLVIFVGGCDGRADELPVGSAIPCRVTSYTGDDHAAGEKRIVIVGPKAGEKPATLYIWSTLPADASKGDLMIGVGKAIKEAPAPKAKAKKLDWSLDELHAAGDEPEHSAGGIHVGDLPPPPAPAIVWTPGTTGAVGGCASGQCSSATVPQPMPRRGLFR